MVAGLTIVIPALNEEETISWVVRSAFDVAENVVVVNDGSSDGTAEAARLCGATVINHPVARGYDCAISAGLNVAFTTGSRFVLTCDADGQHRLDDIARVAKRVVDGDVDFSAGVRDFYNRDIERLCGWLSSVVFGTKDPFCGLKCYSRKMFDQFGPFPENLNIQTLPYVWILHSGLEAAYVPIRVLPRRGNSRFASRFRGNILLARAFSRTIRASLPHFLKSAY